MVSRRRLPILVAFPAFYVGIAVLRAGDVRPAAWVLLPLAIVVAWIGGRVEEGTEPLAARLRIASALGTSLAFATAALSGRPSWAAIARAIGLALSLLAAVRAVGAIDGDVGLAPSAAEATAPKGFGKTTVVRLGQAAVALALAVAVLDDALSWARHTSGGVVAAAAGAFALFAMGATALLTLAVRRLELGVGPRALTSAGVVLSGLVAAVALAFARGMTPDGALAIAGTLTAALVVRLCRSPAPLVLAQQGRRALTLVAFGGPVAALAAIAVEGRMRDAAAYALALAVVALGVGALSPSLEEPFLPQKGILLEALAEARDAAHEREARSAMAHALLRLREASAIGLGANAAPSPELWLLHPTRVITVSSAGYLQERRAELPPGIFDVAMGEVHATLRTSVLRALEVRRADLRPYLAWLDQRGALFATVIAETEDPDGMIVMPAGTRTEEITLEEARAAKLLADGFVAVAQAESAKVRHLQRELDLKRELERAEDEKERLRHTIDLDVGRNALAATRLARPATVGIYSAASRMAYEALERRVAQDAPVVIVGRAGTDPVPFVARAHLSGPRKDGPFVVVDGTSSREHDVERWNDERTSPLALADRGLLLLVDGAALPRDVQLIVARAVAERRAPWERATPLDVVLALSSTAPLEPLVEAGRLTPELAARFETSEPIELPGLSDRAEDLRSIVADRLAREGLRVHGRPTGIDIAAFALLMEHDFEAEDAELAAIVTKLVARATDDVVRAADVRALGIGPEVANDAGATSFSAGRSSGS
ncbi:MAG: hypothetical protein KIT84_12630 [Labilithrix sp.]|nr:hypothetical protein [Labilithrix sp.]MCW5811860.1 hypothetical protein [Labilithrix sp.]